MLEIRINCKNVKEQEKTQTEEIEPNPSKDRAMHERDNPSFLGELITNLLFFLTIQSIFVFLSKYQST
jgi:hypothetical protein